MVRDLSVLTFPESAALTMVGSAAPELLKARACRVVVEGRGGDDVLRLGFDPGTVAPPRSDASSAVRAPTVSSVRATVTSSSAEQGAT